MNIIYKFKTRVSQYGLKYVMKIIMRNKVYRHIDNFVFATAKKILKNAKLKNSIVIESHNDFDCNGGAFYEYLIKNGYNKKYKIVWLVKNKSPKNLPENVYAYDFFKPSIRKSYYQCTAKIMTCDDYILKKGNVNQKIYYLGHGAVSLKKPKGYINLSKDIDYCLTPSEFMVKIKADTLQMDSENTKQIILGCPVHDILYLPSDNEIKKITDKSYAKIILWMPTFRKHVSFGRNDSRIDLPFGIPLVYNDEEMQILEDILVKSNILLIIKIHPMQDLTTVKIKQTEYIKILDGASVKELGIDNYRLMKDVNALISDYSSVAYDYLHLNRPIAYTVDDMGEYNMDFIVDDPKELMRGAIIKDMADMVTFINQIAEEEDCYSDLRKDILDKLFTYQDGNSIQRLINHMQL